MLGDLNARVGNELIKGIVEQPGVPGRNESGERLLELVVGLEQQRTDGGGCASMRKRSERVESPGAYVTE